MPDQVICQYCHRPAMLITGKTMYPSRSDLWFKYFWRCAQCDAHVGCHPGSPRPLGELANAETRKARQAAHAAFDPFWKGKSMKRKEIYQWLADSLGINVQDCHIGSFDAATCRKVVEICSKKGDRS